MSSGHGIAGMLRCARPDHAHAAVRRYGDAHLSEHERDRPRGGQRDFGLWSVRFPLVLVRTGRRLPVQALCERRVLVALTGYPRE